MATISTNPAILGYPMAGVISFADSALGENSTGEIYMLLTDLDIPEKDLKQNNKLTLLFTMAQYKTCTDPMEPTCARLMITGSMKRIEQDSEEYDFGLNAFLSRHPVGTAWDYRKCGKYCEKTVIKADHRILSSEHNFYLAKINIEYLMLQDFYGRPNEVPVADYWAADPSTYVQPSKAESVEVQTISKNILFLFNTGSYRRIGRRRFYPGQVAPLPTPY